MTDKLKESVSALIDGEASEIEVHRLLRQLDTDTTVKPAWINYLQVRAVIQGEPRVSVARHLELHARISRAIDDEEAYRLGPGRRMPVLRTFAKPIAGEIGNSSKGATKQAITLLVGRCENAKQYA